MQDLIIDGNVSANPSSGPNIETSNTASRPSIFRVTTKSAGGDGLKISTPTLAAACCGKIINLMSIGNSGNGLSVYNNNDLFVMQSEFLQNSQNGVLLKNSSAFRIVNSDISGNDNGIYISSESGSTYTSSSSDIVANQFGGQNKSDIYIDGTNGAQGIIVSSNQFIGSSNRPSGQYDNIYILYSQYNVISNNVITSSSGHLSRYGINVNLSAGSTKRDSLVNNTFVGPFSTDTVHLGDNTYIAGNNEMSNSVTRYSGNSSFTGNVGIGTVSPTSKLFVDDQPTDPGTANATVSSLYTKTQVSPVASSTTIFRAGYFQALHNTSSAANTLNGVYGYSQSTSSGDSTWVSGVNGAIWHAGTGTMSNARAGSFVMNNQSTGTVNNGYGGYFGINNSGGGTVNTAYGVEIGAPTNTGAGSSIGTYYGLHIATPTTATTNYALYSAGGTNYFGGSVGIGTTSPTAALDVNGKIRSIAQIATGTGSGTTSSSSYTAISGASASIAVQNGDIIEVRTDCRLIAGAGWSAYAQQQPPSGVTYTTQLAPFDMTVGGFAGYAGASTSSVYTATQNGTFTASVSHKSNTSNAISSVCNIIAKVVGY